MRKIILASLTTLMLTACGTTQEQLEIIKENDFMVIKDDDKLRQSIVCDIRSLETQGFEQWGKHQEYVCINSYDNLDIIVIEDEEREFKIGDKAKLTFFHDDVESVEKIKINDFTYSLTLLAND